MLLLLACTGRDLDDTAVVDTDVESDTDTDTDADTDTDTDADTDTDTDTDTTPGEVANHVLLSFTVADRGEGFDVDGDGEIDNAIWALGGLLDPLVAEGLATAQHVVISQIYGVHDWTDDASVNVGVLSAEDPDGDGSDNGSGAEVFAGGAQLDAYGLVRVSTETALVGGVYTAELATEPLPIGSYELELATGLFAEATVTAEAESGILGFGIALDKLAIALEAEGTSTDIIDALSALADLDLDGDGTEDALSMAFHFDAAACTLE